MKAKEHELFSKIKESLSASQVELFRNLIEQACKSKDKEEQLKYLGIDSNFKASYFIGCSWLIPPSDNENGIAIHVEPKMVDVDYIQMFVTALDVDSSKEAEYFSNCYHIDFNSSPMEIESKQNLITPLLLFHYITLLGQLSKNGLRKNYIRREENLQAKIRGKILFNQHLKRNVFNKRNERIFCAYSEYTIDTPENRLLKKAFFYAKNELERIPSLKFNSKILNQIYSKIAFIELAFENVSDKVSLAQVEIVKSSKLYQHYDEAIKVAKMILQSIDYEILDDKTKNFHNYKVHPFYIDMSRLYEMYVYHLLDKAYPGTIEFQVSGRHQTRVDFIKKDEKIILDAKYKPRYGEGDAGILNDVREISGYARDKKILKKIDWYNEKEISVDGRLGKLFPDCVIIYPVIQREYNENGENDCIPENECEEWNELKRPTKIIDKENQKICNPISAFEGFYKLAIPLPKR